MRKGKLSMNGKTFKVSLLSWILFAAISTILIKTPIEAHEPAEGTLAQIKESGKMRIGFRESQPPMSFLDNNGVPTGYSIDLCKRIFTGVKNSIGSDVTVEYVPVTAKNRFESLIENKVDIVCGATTKTLSRGELVDFTQLTFVTGASLMTRADMKVSELSGLNGKKIGVVQNTTTIDALEKLLKETLTDAKIVSFKTSSNVIDELRNGKIHAFAADQVVLIGLLSVEPDPEEFAIAKDVFSFEPFALPVRRNDADFRLVADRVISHLYQSGQILKIYEKWMGKFIEKRPPILNALFMLNATPE
jgi:ABC-type amino acid transport substrate-binding protein